MEVVKTRRTRNAACSTHARVRIVDKNSVFANKRKDAVLLVFYCTDTRIITSFISIP